MAKESGHFYTKKGVEAYEVPNKSGGGMRKTTIADARKLKLLPSVTTIMSLLNAPGLNVWREKFCIKTTLLAPDMPQEPLDDQVLALHLASKQIMRSSADEGTRIHGVIERWFLEGETDDVKLIGSVEEQLLILGKQNWKAEKVCVGKGYAGKVDLHSDEWVFDIKTKDGDLEGERIWDNHERQISAYAHALKVKRGAVLFVSRDTVDEIGRPISRLVILDDSQMRRGWREFQAILACYKTIKRI